jgi:hypothetical protein
MGCERKPNEQVEPTKSNEIPASCRLERISNMLYVQYNKDGTVLRATFKDSTDEEQHEEIYECFYSNGKLSAYNEIMKNINSSDEKSVSIKYNSDGLISELLHHEGLGAVSAPTHKTTFGYDNFKNKTLLLKYEAAEVEGFWELQDSVVFSNFIKGRPQSVSSYSPSERIIYSSRLTYDANSNLLLIETMGGEITNWRKVMEFVYSSTTKDYMNLLPKAFLLGEYSFDFNENSKDKNLNAYTKKIYYRNFDSANNLLPKDEIEYQEEYVFEKSNSLGYPVKMKHIDAEFDETINYTFQYLCK